MNFQALWMNVINFAYSMAFYENTLGHYGIIITVL